MNELPPTGQRAISPTTADYSLDISRLAQYRAQILDSNETLHSNDALYGLSRHHLS